MIAGLFFFNRHDRIVEVFHLIEHYFFVDRSESFADFMDLRRCK
jgi:hypothetical protein